MKIERERLLEIIKEEVEWARQARPQIEEEVSPWQKLAGMIQEAEGGALQEAMDTESVVQQIEAILNELSSQGLDNEGLKKILSQIIHDIDKGFVGERT